MQFIIIDKIKIVINTKEIIKLHKVKNIFEAEINDKILTVKICK